MVRLLLSAIAGAVVTFAVFAVAASLVQGRPMPAPEVAPAPAARIEPHPVGLAAPVGGAYCEGLRAMAALLLPRARACRSDADCSLDLRSCSVLGTGSEADAVHDLRAKLETECGEPVAFSWCGDTRPVCDEGVCSARRVERPGEPPLGLLLPEVVCVDPAAAASSI